MKCVFLGGEGELTNAVINILSEVYFFEQIIIEDSVPKKQFLKNRVKKLGVICVCGQLAFKGIIVPILGKVSKARINEIVRKYQLNFSDSYRKSKNYMHIENINSPRCIERLKEIMPDIIVVNGTRILNAELIESTNAVIINMHLGITPKYRGVHGAYWAFYNRDAEHAGVTIHLVDKGIDTGSILYQAIIQITKKDNFVTYPYIQVGEGIKLEVKAIKDLMQNHISIMDNKLSSNLYYHPTLWQYITGVFFRKCK